MQRKKENAVDKDQKLKKYRPKNIYTWEAKISFKAKNTDQKIEKI
ncbi:MAG: hypothetical protein G01um101456_50 [Parcubacteria group bacterium Gr01-1014_56]|nr:MAG: hypothetical protein G01um101456_50 [Parcubacteria group bacterium Gr01-1014_56]